MTMDNIPTQKQIFLFRRADRFRISLDRYSIYCTGLSSASVFGRGTVNLLVCGAYYVCQAVGIGIVGLLFAKQPTIAGGRVIPFWATIITVVCATIALFLSAVPIIIAAGVLMNITIGVLSGCYLTRLATDIHSNAAVLSLVLPMLWQYRHMAFVFADEHKVPLEQCQLLCCCNTCRRISYSSAISFTYPPKQDNNLEQRNPKFNKKIIWLAATVLFLLSLENTLGFSFPLKSASKSVYIEFTRAFYALGLIIAGFVSDKSRRWGAICCLAALAFPFAALAHGNNAVGETAMWIIAYMFLGFWSTYRILLFSDISAKRALPGLAVAGLLVGRLGEALGTFGASVLTGTSLIV